MGGGKGPKAEQSLKGEWTLQERCRRATSSLLGKSVRVYPRERQRLVVGKDSPALKRGKEKPH